MLLDLRRLRLVVTYNPFKMLVWGGPQDWSLGLLGKVPNVNIEYSLEIGLVN